MSAAAAFDEIVQQGVCLDVCVGSTSCVGVARYEGRWVRVIVDEMSDEDVMELFPSAYREVCDQGT